MSRAARILIALAFVSIVAAASTAGAQSRNQQTQTVSKPVRLAVGGKPALFYLPLTVTEQLGYFKDEGLDVQISDFSGGARALQSLIGGSADVVAGAFDHTIQMQAKGQPIVGVVELGQFPGFVLAVRTALAAAYRGPADLKGMKIGITAPGSSTHFMARYLMTQAGLKEDDASFIGVGSSASAVASVQRGEVDALVHVDPIISLLESDGAIKIVADTRTPEGTRQVFGGAYPAAVLYVTPIFAQRNPDIVQSLANAMVRGLRWIAHHSAEEIAAVMPAEYALGDRAVYLKAIKSSLPMYSPDGRIEHEAAEVAHRILSKFDPDVQRAVINLETTYTNAFVDKAPAR